MDAVAGLINMKIEPEVSQLDFSHMVTIGGLSIPPLIGALLKNEQDVSLFEKLIFMQKNNR